MKTYLSILNIKGTKITGENPLPMMCERERDQYPALINPEDWPKEKLTYYGEENGFRVLPYKILDRYERTLKQRQYKLVILENENLRAEILPDFGGKLYSLKDKSTGKDLVFRDPIIRMCNIAARDAWTAGGIEWNLGQHMHTYFACSPVYVAKLHDTQGNEFVRIYEYERLRGIFYQLDFHLPSGAKALFTHGRVINDSGRDVFFDWWSDMGIKEEEKMRVLSGADMVAYISPVKDRKEEGFPFDFGYCSQKELSKRFGFDVTYPEYFKFCGEYFLQGPKECRSPWLSAVYPDGFVFFNRSTSRLINKKMFTWGTHNAGNRWKDYLFDKNIGNHIEIQSGMATTQHHSCLLKDKDVWEWTEAFSSVSLENVDKAFVSDIDMAKKYVSNAVDKKLSEDEIYKWDNIFRSLSSAMPDEILAQGTGFGTLERKRREKYGQTIPSGIVFPDSAIGENELPWLNLLENGIYQEIPENMLPSSWMTCDKNWIKMLTDSMKKEGGKNHSSLTQLGVMLYEKYEFDKAIDLWKESVALKPNAIAYRNLAYAYNAGGERDKAEEYMRKALDIGGMEMDPAFSEEYIRMLVEHKKYNEAWEFYKSEMPESMKTDKVLLYAGLASVETGNEDFVLKIFDKELKNIREYENDKFTADMWYKYQAIKEAKKRNVPLTPELIHEIENTLEVPASIDYRVVL